MAGRYIYNNKIRNAPIRRRLDRRFLSWVIISAFAGIVITSVFVYSARCHFEAMELGYKTQQRRVEIEQQQEQRRRLELERTRALSPEELEERAREIGLRNPEAPKTPDSQTKAASQRKAVR